MVQVMLLRRTLDCFPNPSALVSISKVMQAVKLAPIKYLQFLTQGSG